jgi:hypothetical protein
MIKNKREGCDMNSELRTWMWTHAILNRTLYLLSKGRAAPFRFAVNFDISLVVCVSLG